MFQQLSVFLETRWERSSVENIGGKLAEELFLLDASSSRLLEQLDQILRETLTQITIPRAYAAIAVESMRSTDDEIVQAIFSGQSQFLNFSEFSPRAEQYVPYEANDQSHSKVCSIIPDRSAFSR